MSIKRLLYIDDNKIPSQIDKLRRKLKSQGYDLDETFLYLDDDFFKKRDEATNKTVLDKSKIQGYIVEKYSNESFDIIASDFDFNDPNLDGFTLLKWIKNESQSKKYKFRRAKFCLYSADQDTVAEKAFNTPLKIRQLVKLRIDDFVERERIAEELTEIFIAPQKTYYFKEHLVKYLEKHGDELFKSVYPKFKGKTLSEIAREIDKDSVNGIEFQHILVEITVAHLIELNNLPKE